MQSFMDFWTGIESWQRVVILLGGMVIFWLLEGYYPHTSFSWKRYKHAGINLLFLLSTLVLNLALGSITIIACKWVTDNDFGLLNVLDFPLWANVILGLFFMDFFSQYAPYYAMHKVKWMWKFH